MESLQMEVEDFKSAVKLQSVAMDKFHQTRSEEVHKFNNLYIINKYLLFYTRGLGDGCFISDDFNLMFNLFLINHMALLLSQCSEIINSKLAGFIRIE